MENFYNAYTKIVDEKTYYFVKRYLAFPEFEHVSPVMEGYGMHADFVKACQIAGVKDPAIQHHIFQQLNANIPLAKVIDLKPVHFESRSATK